MADAGTMEAQLTLKFEDLVSPALKSLLEKFAQLRQLGERLGLGGLPKGAKAVSELTQQTTRLNREMETVGSSAGKALGKIESVWTRLKSAMGLASRETEQLNKRLNQAGGRGVVQRSGALANAVGAAVSGATFLAPIEASADYDFKLRHTAITEGFSGQGAEDEIKRLGKMFQKEALETGQSSTSIAAAFQDLIQSGLTREQAEGVIGAHSRAATAYGIDPEAMGHAVFAMRKNMGIDDETMQQALGGLAQASKEGLFKMGDFSAYLTGQSGQAAALGMTGLKGVGDLAALNEVVSQRTTDPAQAGQWVASALGYINTPATAHSFKKAGIDLNGEMRKNMAGGMNQFDSFLKIIKDATNGLTGRARSEKLGAMFGRGEERQVWQAVLDMQQEFEERRQKYAGVSKEQAGTDFNTAFQGVGVQMTMLKETTLQITRAFGDEFVPVLRVVNTGLGKMLGLVQWAKQEWPQTTHYIMMGTGAIIVLAAALGAAAFVVPILSAGFGVLASVLGVVFSPITLVIAAIAAVAALAYLIYENWDRVGPWFRELWDGIVARFQQTVAEFAAAGRAVVDAIKAAFDGLVEWFSGLWSQIATKFKEMVMGPLSALKNGWVGRQLGIADKPDAQPGQPGQGGATPDASAAAVAGANRPQVNVRVDHAPPGTTVETTGDGDVMHDPNAAKDFAGPFAGIP